MRKTLTNIAQLISCRDSWWKVITEILIWGILTGFVIRFLLDFIIEEFSLGFHHTIIIATVYSAVFVILGRVTQTLTDRYFPFRDHYDLLYQILARTGYIVVAFLMGTFIAERGLPYNVTILDWEKGTAWIILGVSFVAGLLGNGIYQLSYFYNRMMKAERSAMKSQISTLRAQINPHFLFNSLNSIAGLIRSDPEKAEAVTEDLAELFRYSLRSSEQEMVTLEEEISSVKTYYAIEKARFGDRIELIVTIPDELMAVSLPPLVLQPLVENAIKHGASNSSEPCRIEITALDTNGVIEISVTDTGSGFDEPEMSDRYFVSGHGLHNVKERVESTFYRSGSVDLLENGVKMKLPL